MRTRSMKIFQQDIPDRLPKKICWAGTYSPNIRYQQELTSCWAFTATTVYEYILRIEDKVLQGNEKYIYSPQQLVDCVDPNKKPTDANGGYTSSNNAAFKWIQENGIALESSYQFQGKKGKCVCNDQSNVGPKIHHVEKISKTDDKWLHKVLSRLEKHPIAGAIPWGPISLQKYKKEIYKGLTSEDKEELKRLKIRITPEPKHAVTLVGYGADAESSELVFIFQNSYGKKWGMSGFGKVARDQVYCTSYPVFEV